MVMALPLFNYLDIDAKLARTTITELFEAASDDFQQMMQPSTRELNIFHEFHKPLFTISDELISFRVYVTAMLDFYFERLKKRNEEHYAVGVYGFFSNRAVQRDISESLPPLPVYLFRQSRHAMIEYATMPNPDDEKKYIIAERMLFHSIASFLHTDFFRGLMNGNAPRRCYNCKRFFLLSNGYDTCYCNNIAPGETEKTCRKVGAHK